MKRLFVSIILILGLLACVNSSLANNTERAVINGKTSDRVHLRAEPSTDSESLGLYFTGTEVSYITDTEDEWVWVNIGSETGYIKSEFLYFGNDSGSVIAKQPIGTVNNKNGSWVNLRPDPTSEYEAIGKCYNGDTITVLGETVTKWYYVKTGEQYGYIMSDFVTMGSPNLPSTPGPSSGRAAAIAALKSVLKNNSAFISASDNRNMYLNQLPGSFAGARMEIAQFAVIDLDHDSMPEVVLWENVNGNVYGVEVLHYQDGAVYGYEFGHRQLGQLKMDGTFSFSSSASDSGIGALIFSDSTYVIDEITYSQSSNTSNNLNVQYFVNKIPATKSEFSSMVNSQGKKQDAAWLLFTADNINSIL